METKICPETASKLRLKWKFYAGRDITATPAIFNGNLYFPSWNGYIYAIKASDGSLIWKQNLKELTGFNATGFVLNVNWTVSRSTPTVAYDRDLLVIGIYGPAVVIAVKRSTGELLWSTQLDSQAAGVITTSGTYYKGLVKSQEVNVIDSSAYQLNCMQFCNRFLYNYKFCTFFLIQLDKYYGLTKE